MKPAIISSDFVKKLTDLFIAHLVELIYSKVPHALYIESPDHKMELIQDSEFFKTWIRNHVLNRLAHPTGHTILYIEVDSDLLIPFTQDQWESDMLDEDEEYTYLNYQFESHLLTLAIN